MGSRNAFQKSGVAVLALLFAGIAAAEPGITADKIVIGQAAGFTGSVAGTVKELTAGAQLYFDHVNSKGGVHGRRSCSSRWMTASIRSAAQRCSRS